MFIQWTEYSCHSLKNEQGQLWLLTSKIFLFSRKAEFFLHLWAFKSSYKPPLSLNLKTQKWVMHLAPIHIATDTTTSEAMAKNMNKAWLLETERQTCCRIKCPLLKSISYYLSVCSFPLGSLFPTAKRSLQAQSPYLTPGCISAHQFQRNADIRVLPLWLFLFIPLLFINTASVVFRAIYVIGWEILWFFFLS